MNAYPYDLHIHSCLSPCGDDDMTPNNLVGMAALSGCQVIAITDHNTCKNAGAVMEAGREAGLLVVPGMELCTAEEAHVVCLFETLEGAMVFDQYVWENMPHIPNRPEIFGEQRLMDSQDRQTGLLEDLLLVSSFLGVDQVPEIAARYGGVAFPAHVNRDSYSVLASLGTIPPRGGVHRRGGHQGLRPGGPGEDLPPAERPEDPAQLRLSLPGDPGHGGASFHPSAGAFLPGGGGGHPPGKGEGLRDSHCM